MVIYKYSMYYLLISLIAIRKANYVLGNTVGSQDKSRLVQVSRDGNSKIFDSGHLLQQGFLDTLEQLKGFLQREYQDLGHFIVQF